MLEEAAKNPLTAEPRYETAFKMAAVRVPQFEFEHKVFSDNRDKRHVAPDTIKMGPGPAKRAWEVNQIEIIKGGCCDLYTFDSPPVYGYRPWLAGDDKVPVADGREHVWVRCRLTKSIMLIVGLEEEAFFRPIPNSQQWEPVDFFLPWWFVRSSGVSFTLENENPSYRAPLEIAVPQRLPAEKTASS